jgi:phosphatidylserine synthase
MNIAPTLSFMLVGFPIWHTAFIGDKNGLFLLWLFASIIVAGYLLIRKIEVTGYGPYSRQGFGEFLMAKAGAILLASAIAWKHWPEQSVIVFLVMLLVFYEGYRMSNNWKLFLPVRKK